MDAILGEIRLFAGDYAPEGWHACDGTVLNVADHEALFSLIGKTYGGDGQANFALPDLRGRIPLGAAGREAGAKSGDAFKAQERTSARALAERAGTAGKSVIRMALTYIIAINGSYPDIV